MYQNGVDVRTLKEVLGHENLNTTMIYTHVTDENMKTNIPGVFAAGDIRVKSLRQVVTAAADGAIAAVQCEKYLG